MKKFVIVDGNAIIHRAYHAVPPLTAKDGTMVNAVYGFTSMLLKVLSDIKPDYIAVSFDVAGPTFRDELYTEYKATRVKADQDLYDQIPLVHDMVRAFGIPIFVKEGFEADDVIGTIATKNKQKDGLITIIVTGDRDMLQLVDDDITEVYLLKKGITDVELYNEAKVFERFQFGPESLVEFKALRGDSSDNIPGVRGIGEKTAQALIEKIGGIDEIYAQLEKDNSPVYKSFSASIVQKLKDGKESAYMSRQLGTIHCDVPDLSFESDNCAAEKITWAAVSEELKKFEFFSLLKRLPGYVPAPVTQKEKKRVLKKTVPVTVVTQTSQFDEMAALILKERAFTAKETLVGDAISGTWSGLSIIADGKGFYIDVERHETELLRFLKPIVSEAGIIFSGHDLKPLIKLLVRHKLEIQNTLFDCMIGSYVLNAASRVHDLPAIIMREIGVDVPAESAQNSLFGDDPGRVIKTLQHVPEIVALYQTKLVEEKQADLFQSIEMKLLPVLAHMELAGVAVDTDMLAQLSKEVAENITSLTDKIYYEAGFEFNIASSVQLRDVLFEHLGLPTQGIKKGKTGYSTAAPELEKLRELHPIIGMVEEYREVEKLRNTYIDVLPTLINKKTGRIHTTFNQTVAATGRLSSSDPNLQNIPIRSELGKKIRQAFIADKGNVLVAADYSQIELRIVAALAKDKKLTDIFIRGEDVHTATAALIHGIPLADVTKEIRRTAKEVNFGVLYGMGAFGLAARTGIPQQQAREFIQNYFKQFSGVKHYLDDILDQAKKCGYVETLFGRRRHIPDLTAKNAQLRNAAERMAINMPIQGTAADMMKMAMIAVHDRMKKYGDDARVTLQVHDEIVLEVKQSLAEDVAREVKEIMETVVDHLSVPIVVEAHIGERWGELK